MVSFYPDVLLLISLLLKPRLPCHIPSVSWYYLSHITGSTRIPEFVNVMQSLWGICLRHPKLLFFSLGNQPSLGQGKPEEVTVQSVETIDYQNGKAPPERWSWKLWNIDDVSQFNCYSPLNCPFKWSAWKHCIVKQNVKLHFPKYLNLDFIFLD